MIRRRRLFGQRERNVGDVRRSVEPDVVDAHAHADGAGCRLNAEAVVNQAEIVVGSRADLARLRVAIVEIVVDAAALADVDEHGLAGDAARLERERGGG